MDWLGDASHRGSAAYSGHNDGHHHAGASSHNAGAAVGAQSMMFPMTHSRIDPSATLQPFGHDQQSTWRAVAFAIRSRFFYADAALEGDFLVFFVKDRLTAVVLMGLVALGGAAGFGWSLQHASRHAVQAVVLDLVALVIWISAFAGCVYLYRDATRLRNCRSEIDYEGTAVQPVGGAAAGRSAAAQRSRGRMPRVSEARAVLVAQQRHNAALHERVMLSFNAAFFLVAMSHYLTKGDCTLPADTPDRHYRCLNSIGLEAVVVLAYGLSVTISRSRTLYQAASMLSCTVLYFVVQGIVSPATGTPDATTQQAFVVVVVVLAVLSVGTIFFVDRSERGHFQELRKLERHRDEASRLANYCASIASSVMPSSVVARLSRGGAVRDMLPAAAVCCVGLQHSAESFMQCSPHELVQLLQRFKSSLDAAGRLVEGLAKVHTMGDTHMVVAGEATGARAPPASGEGSSGVGAGAAPAEAGALEAVLCFLWHFVLLRGSDQWSETAVSERSYGSLMDSQSSDGGGRAVQAVAAVECGGVCLASIGSHCFVALGRTVRTAELMQRLAAPTLLHDERALIRLSAACAVLLPHCAHRFPTLPDAATARAGIASTRIDGAKWCPDAVASPKAANPLDPEMASFARGEPGLTSPSSTISSAIRVDVVDCMAVLLPRNRWDDPTTGPAPSTTNSSSTGRPQAVAGAGSTPPPSTRRLSSSCSSHETPGAGVSTAARRAKRFLLVRHFLVASQFADDDTESAFQAYVREYDDRQRSQWEFICMLCIALSMLAVCFINGLHNAPVAVDTPLFWVIVSCVASLVGTMLSTLLNSSPIMIGLLRVVECLFVAAYILSCLVADHRSILGSGDLLWFILLLELCALRERRQGLLLHCAAVPAIAVPFVARVLLQYSIGVVRSVVLAMLCATVAAGIGCFVLWDRFRREQYATARAIELLEEEYLDDVGRLHRMLEVMIPSTVVGKLIDVVRGALESGDNDFTLAVRGAPLPRVKALTHNVWQSPFTTFTEDIPLLVARVFPAASWGADDCGAFPGEIGRAVAVLGHAQRVVLEALRSWPTLCMVKMCGDTLMVAEQSAGEATDKAAALGRAAVRMARALREARIGASVALVAGPLVGAVLGTTAITFEYYGHAASQGLALLEELPQGEVYASERFAALVEFSLRIPNGLLPQPPEFVATLPAQEDPPRNSAEWQSGVAAGPLHRMQLRYVGRVWVRRISA